MTLSIKDSVVGDRRSVKRIEPGHATSQAPASSLSGCSFARSPNRSPIDESSFVKVARRTSESSTKSVSRVDATAVCLLASNAAFAMLAQFGQLKLDDVECRFHLIRYGALDVSRAHEAASSRGSDTAM